MDPLTVARELRAALALTEVDGLGPGAFRRLVDRRGSAREVLAAADRLERPEGMSRRAREELRRTRPVPAGRLEALEARGIRLVSYGGPGYPGRLHHLAFPPPVLWLQGPGSLPRTRAAVVVGTRKATGYGRRMARDLGAGFATAGWTVVSGMAAGVDGAAHRGALDAGGSTVGVLGSGLDHEYPSIHRPLYRRMREAGLLASEFPPEEGPRAAYFPRRNRILAALADAVVVVQAGRRSGALITASLALELGREVFAVPGPVGPPASVGVHGLLRDGAAPATGAADVVRALEGRPVDRPGVADEERTAPSRDRLAALLGPEAPGADALCRRLVEGPCGGDELAREAELDAARAAALLGRLELEGIVRGLPGGRWELAPVPGARGDAVGERPAGGGRRYGPDEDEPARCRPGE